jgi:hypothetical protein
MVGYASSRISSWVGECLWRLVWLSKNEVVQLSRSCFTSEVRPSKNGIYNKMARFGYRSGGGSGSETTKP